MPFVIYKPTAPPKQGTEGLASRPSTLNGKTVAIFWNSKVNADIYLQRIRERLEEKYPDARFVTSGKPTATRPMGPEVLERLKSVDAVVNAFGD